MPDHHKLRDTAQGEEPLRIARTLRDMLREGYAARDLRADVMAAVVVGIVALPLTMSLAIASGVPRLETRRPGPHH